MKGMRVAVLLCLGVVFSAVALYAAVTWHSGPNFQINPFPDLLVTGTVSGLGNNATVQVDADGTGSGSCTNPGGHLPNPFQDVAISGSGSENIHAHNGSSDVNVVVSVEPSNTCPNKNWRPSFNQIQWTTATITIYTSSKGQQSNLFGPTTYGLTSTDSNAYPAGTCGSTGSIVVCIGTE